MPDAEMSVQILEGDKVVESKPLPPDEHIVICGERKYVDGVQVYGNGTVIVTIKRVPVEHSTEGEG